MNEITDKEIKEIKEKSVREYNSMAGNYKLNVKKLILLVLVFVAIIIIWVKVININNTVNNYKLDTSNSKIHANLEYDNIESTSEE